MKENLLIILVMAFCSIAGLVYATSVTTQDGINFSVTNDGGFTSNMTMPQIITQVNSFGQRIKRDSIAYLSDQEIYLSWGQVQNMATVSLNQWQANQSN